MQPPDEISATPAPSLESANDTRLLAGRYRLGRLLGKGGMGAVFEARHAALGKPVAVKLLDRCVEVSEELEQRFAREARAASRIDHPGVVDVIDFGISSDGRLYYVMELLDGVLLSELLAEVGPLPVAHAVDITVQICRAMTAAHQLQLLHRDLKPANIMLVPHPDGRDRVKVLDFGLAKDLLPASSDDHLTLPGTMLGTPEYMAPEQAMGLPADTRSDIYSIGVVLYELLTGQIPYAGNTPEEILQRKRLEPARPIDELRPDLPDDLTETIMSCLALKARARPRTMLDLADALMPLAPPPGDSGDETVGPPAHDIRAADAMPGSAGLTPTGTTQDSTPTDIVAPRRPKRRVPWILLVTIAIFAGGALALVLRQAGTAPSSDPAPRAHKSSNQAAAMPNGAAMPVMHGANDTSPHRTDAQVPKRRHSASSPPDRPMRPRSPLSPRAMSSGMGSSLGRSAPASMGTPVDAKAQIQKARALLNQANRHLSKRLFGAAHKAFAGAATIPGFRGAGLTGLARVAFEQRRWATAARAARRAVAGGGGSRARMYLGNSLFKLGRYADAARVYRAVLARQPGHAGAQRLLALARKRLEQD